LSTSLAICRPVASESFQTAMRLVPFSIADLGNERFGVLLGNPGRDVVSLEHSHLPMLQASHFDSLDTLAVYVKVDVHGRVDFLKGQSTP